MKCQWTSLQSLMPSWLRRELPPELEFTCQELRLREQKRPSVVTAEGLRSISGIIKQEDLSFIVNMASRYSPWCADTLSEGYLTAPGGHRIGVCGECIIRQGSFSGIRKISSLCIRVARDFPGLADDLRSISGSLLILGAPGWGKTTLLRDLIRQRSNQGYQIAVVDEREELFPEGFDRGESVDVLSGCPKSQGILTLLKNMGPQILAVDEITSERDCQALVKAVGCGVQLLTTIHGENLEQLAKHPIYQELFSRKIFNHYVVLRRDRSWHLERSVGCKVNGLGPS